MRQLDFEALEVSINPMAPELSLIGFSFEAFPYPTVLLTRPLFALAMASANIRPILTSFLAMRRCCRMIFHHQDYRSYLKATLSERNGTSKGYSLRAFSEKVGISNSFLSEVLNNKKALSVEIAFKIAIRLNLTELETQYLCLLVQIEQEKDSDFREELFNRLNALNPTQKRHDLSIDLFKIISDWHHFAILELSYLPSFSGEPEYIAKKLGISRVDADLALGRLLRLGLLEVNNKGSYKKAHDVVLTESKIPMQAFKRFHAQLLEKAKESLEAQTPKSRLSATDIISFDSKHLPAVDKLSRQFSAAVMKISEQSKVKDNVYALSVHFFNLTPNQRTET